MSQSVSATRAGLPQLIVLLVGSCMPVLGAVLLSPVLPRMSEHFAATPGAAVLVPVVLTVPALFVAPCFLHRGRPSPAPSPTGSTASGC